MKKKALLFILLLPLLVGCSAKHDENKKLTISTSFYPMYYFTKEIVKDKATVTMVTPSNTEPHDYEPSAKVMANISDSSLFIYNSEAMETWVPNLKKTLADNSNVTFVKASKGIQLTEESPNNDVHKNQHEDKEHSLDPHVWLNPVLAKKEVQTITSAIIKKDPDNKETYEKNSAVIQKKLDQLNQQFIQATKNAKHKTFVTQHAAFGYLARQYGLKQKSIAGIDPEQEPTPKELAHIESFVKKEKIHYIYTEETASSKVAKTVKEATDTTLLPLNTLESVSEKEQKEGQNYFTIMENNLNNLKKTLQ